MSKKFTNKTILLFTCLFCLCITNNAQVTTNSGSGLAPTYTSLDAAITALNAATITSPVVITLTASNPQTTPAGGYSISAEGTTVNTIRIVGNNNTITAPTPQVAGNLNDGLFKIIGGDNISIENFILTENAANTITDAGTNTMTEWGIAVLYSSATNGSQNISIKNCTVDLNRTYQNTFGIYSNSNHSATAISSASPATALTGNNSGLSITGSTVTDVNIGIVVIGPTTANNENDGLTIGGSALNANTISNFGTTGTFSGYANVSATVNGILIRNVKNLTITHNTITSSVGGTISGSLRGIYMQTGTAPVGTIVNNISNNTISLQSALATGAIQGISVEATTVNATTSFNFNSNNFTNLSHTVAASAAINGIINTSPALNVSINNNTFTNIITNTTGSFTFLSSSVTLPSAGTQTVSNNSIVTAFSKTGDGGTVAGFLSSASSPTGTSVTHTNNNFSNITVVGATVIEVWRSRDGASTTSGPIKNVSGNIINNINGGTGLITGLVVNASAATSTISNNTISNINSSGSITGLQILSNENGSFVGNLINGLSSNGSSSTVSGIVLSGTGATNNTSVLKNKIYNLQASGSTGSVNGVLISYTGIGVVATIANNLIGDLKAPITNNDASDVVRGISITATTTTATFNVYYNTIFINATSSGANFGTTGIFHTSSTTPTTATLDLRNNIIINNSTTAGFGNTAALRRSTGSVDNYASTSNNNIFYAGVPSTTNLIYNDGSPYQTLSVFQTAVATRETNSKTENVAFTSTAGSSIGFLHVNASITSLANAGALPIATILDDYDGQTRNATTPDIGADEYDVALPVTLINFSGVKNNEGNSLNWQTANEINNTGFEILRSNDGINFSKIAFVKSLAINNNSASQYNFVDRFPLTTSNYYSLKQIDKDGKSTISNIVLLKGIKLNKLLVSSIYPNPAQAELRLLINAVKTTNGSLTVVDYSGKIVLNKLIALVDGENNVLLNIATLQNGNYILQLHSNNETAVSKFIKQ